MGVRRDGWGGEIDMVVSGLGGVGQICWVCGWIWRGWPVDRGEERRDGMDGRPVVS